MIKSLRSRIFLVVGGLVFLTTISMTFLVQREVEKAAFSTETQHAQDLVNTVLLNVETQYESLLFHRSAMLERRKAELKNIVNLAFVHLNEFHQRAIEGSLSEEEAKLRAMNEIRPLRYDEGVGYIWINDLDPNLPRLVMHPIFPELEGKILDDPKYYSALGVSKHLLHAAAELTQKEGEGYVDYVWPKPTKEGITEEQPKISYVRLFREWGWVVGTGVYVDDIEKEAQKRLNAILAELNQTFLKIRVAETGYMAIFDGNKDMLVHPSLVGTNIGNLMNPVTGKPVADEIMEAAKTPAKPVDYLWDRPEDKGEYRYWKRAYVVYFEPLDWYIVSTFYLDEITKPGRTLQTKIIQLSVFFLAVSFVLALFLSKSVAKPLWRLMQAAKRIEELGIAKASIPVSGSAETQKLGAVLDKMIRSIRRAINEKENAMGALAASNENLSKANLQLKKEISVRKHAEDELLKSERKLSDLTRSLPGMVYRCRNDQYWTMEYVSDGCSSLTGYQPDDLIDNKRLPFIEIVHPEDRERLRKRVETCLAYGKPFQCAYRIRTARGDIRWILEVGRGVFTEEGGPESLEGFLTDITDRKQAEEDLKEANRELDAFVYTVSHDLRTPLTPIIGYADFLRENFHDRLDEQALDCLAEISTSGNRMLAVMEDLLTLAQVGQVERPTEPFEIKEVVNEVVRDLDSRLSKAGVVIEVGDLPYLRIPKTLLAQIFDNLIGNAIRYAGREGSPIEIQGERKGELVRFYVRDHGLGIPKEERSHIFEVFYRGATGKKSPGTGVGLATVQKIASLYGGRAWVEDTEGGGSTFWVEMVDDETAAEK